MPQGKGLQEEIASHGAARHSTVQHNMARHGTAQPVTASPNTAHHGTARYDMTKQAQQDPALLPAQRVQCSASIASATSPNRVLFPAALSCGLHQHSAALPQAAALSEAAGQPVKQPTWETWWKSKARRQ